jgi:predicted pyridoxine 5'-phosphate oxidase superfamily flavin-nucleotide-binding protein
VGFHDGELAVQRRAGVRDAAQRLTGMLDAPDLRGSIGRFLAERTFAAITARDADRRLWISPLTGPRGFLDVVGAANLLVHSTPSPGDPLHRITAGQPVGLLAIEFAKRRRVRVNGTLTGACANNLTIEVDQAYGNCPQYIQQRALERLPDVAATPAGPTRLGHELTPADIDLVRSADTALFGTTHPERGSDASHRGGLPGFVRVEDSQTLWWPDYPGNNMFNSFGNLAVDPAAALLFVDFASGTTLHLSGTAELEWAAAGAGDDGGTGRRVRFAVEVVSSGPSLPMRAGHVVASPHNPPLIKAVRR